MGAFFSRQCISWGGLIGAQALLGALPAWGGPPANMLPTGGTIVSGAANVSVQGAQMTVAQKSASAIMRWDSFNIGANAAVVFQQPSSSSVVLNRVLSNDASQIFGRLSANGQVFLVNPNGIYFAPGASVNTGGLVASAFDIQNEDFSKGIYRFTMPPQQPGSIVNEGTLEGGRVALIGAKLVNNGLVATPGGTAALVSGGQVTLDFHGDGLLDVRVDGAAMATEIRNKGMVVADGGMVIMKAQSKDALLESVVNNEGIARARSVSARNGVVVLEADSGAVLNSGQIDVSGKSAGETGGTAELRGQRIALLGSASIDASGQQGGGAILIGGDYRGKDAGVHANSTYVGAGTAIQADALEQGDGGKVIVWSDDSTAFYGSISARGGIKGGNGGLVETSGKNILAVSGEVDAGAKNGAAGLWLMDPYDVTISNAVQLNESAAGGTFTPTANSAVVNATSIRNALYGTNGSDGTNVLISTGSAGTGTQNGDITVSSPITYGNTVPRTLTLQAARGISFQNGSGIVPETGASALNVNLNARALGGSEGFINLDRASISSNGGDINLFGGNFAVSGTSDVAIGSTASGVTRDGIHLNGATLNAGGGNILMRGQGATSATTGNNSRSGVYIGNEPLNIGGTPLTPGSTVTTSGNGTISITGRGGSNTTNTTYGVVLGQSTIVSAKAGELDITGIGGTGSGTGSAGGIRILDGPANQALISTTSGNINLIGNAGVSGTGDRSGILFGGTAQPVHIESVSGNISVAAAGGGTSFGITSSSSNQLNWVASASGNILINSSSMKADGSAAGTGLEISAPGGNVRMSSNGTMSSTRAPLIASSLELLGAGASYTATGSGNMISTLGADTGAIKLSTVGDFTMGAAGNTQGVKTTGALTVTGAGSITQAQALAAGGNVSLTASGKVSLLQGPNVTGSLTVNSAETAIAQASIGGSLTLNASGPVSLADSTVSSSIKVSAGGNTTLTGAIQARDLTVSSGSGSGNGAVLLGGDTVIQTSGATAFGSLNGNSSNLTITARDLNLSGNWSGTGTYVLQPNDPTLSLGLGGGIGTFSLSAAEMAFIGNSNAAQVSIGRADAVGSLSAAPFSFGPPLFIKTGGTNFTPGNYAFSQGLELQANGNVTFASSMTSSNVSIASAGGPVTIRATGNIDASRDVSNTAAISTQGGAITLNARSANGTTGYIDLRNTTLDSGGGKIVLGGGSDPSTGYTIGDSTYDGINFGNTLIMSGVGDISIRGQAGDPSRSGVRMDGTSNLIASSAGNILVSGKTEDGIGVQLGAGSHSVSTTSGNITLDGTATTGDAVRLGASPQSVSVSVTTVDGNILLTGTANGDIGRGVILGSGAIAVEATGKGSITMNGTATGSGGGVLIGMADSTTSSNTLVKTASGKLSMNGVSGTGYGLDVISSGTDATGRGQTRIESIDGDIALTGTSTTTVGLRNNALNNGDTTITTANGTIFLTGISQGGYGLTLNPTSADLGVANVTATGKGNIVLAADQMQIDGSAANITGNGGTLTIEPVTPSSSVAFGVKVNVPALTLPNSAVSAINGNYAAIYVGNADTEVVDFGTSLLSTLPVKPTPVMKPYVWPVRPITLEDIVKAVTATSSSETMSVRRETAPADASFFGKQQCGAGKIKEIGYGEAVNVASTSGGCAR